MEYERNHGTFSSTVDGKSLFFQSWKPPASLGGFDPQRNVVLVHGAFEHSERYHPFVTRLAPKGASFWAFDLRGHGRTEGPRGVAHDVATHARDIDDFINYIHLSHGVRQPVLLGHSLGGLLVLSYASNVEHQPKLRGLATSAAAISVKMNFVLWIKQILAKYVLGPFFPNITLPVGLQPKNLSHDENVIRDYMKDPLVFDRMNLGLAVSILNEGERLSTSPYPVPNLPVLMAHGTGDEIAFYLGTEQTFERVQSSNKTLKLYTGLYHEIFNETPELRAPVDADFRSWIEGCFSNSDRR